MTRDEAAMLRAVGAGRVEVAFTPDPDGQGSFYWKLVGYSERRQRHISRLSLDGLVKIGTSPDPDVKPMVLTTAGRNAVTPSGPRAGEDERGETNR